MLSDISPQTIGVVAAVAVSNLAVLLWWRGWPESVRTLKMRITQNTARAWVFLGAALAVIWIAIFLVYHYPVTGDVKLYFQPYGRAVMAGGIPDVDFRSSYMPLFPYVLGVVDKLWPSDLSIPLFFTACFTLGCLLLGKVMADGGMPKEKAASLAIVGALNGAAWFLAVGYQQDETLLFLLAAAAMFFFVRGDDLIGGLILGIGLLSTKILFGITALALLSQSAKQGRVLLGAMLVGVPCLALFTLLGFNPLLMLSGETGRINSPSLTALVGSFPQVYGRLSPSLWTVHALSGVWCLSAATAFRKPSSAAMSSEGMVRMMIILWMGFLLISPKSLTSYRIVILPLLPFLLDRFAGRRAWVIPLFALYSTAVGIQFMFYEHWIDTPYALFLGQYIRDAHRMLHLSIVLVLDVIILSLEVVWLIFALQWKQEARR